MTRCFLVLLVAATVSAVPTFAQGRAAAARELAEYLMRKFGKESVEEGVETLTKKVEPLLFRYGDDAANALRKVGPRVFRLVDDAGVHAPDAIKLMARYGDEAVWVVADKKRMAIFLKHGDDAAEAMMKHQAIVEPLLESVGRPAATALKPLSKQNARRLVMLAEDGDLARIGRTEELLAVIGRYGDKAADFVWRHKGSLAVGAVLTAFLADPEPFINGAKDLAKVVGEAAVKPLAEVPQQVAVEAAKRTNWTLIGLTTIAAVGLFLALRGRAKGRSESPAA
ncbi:MAG: hypothetical protein N2039_02865 [Gemmataceae bacterium]|nr:hypothetical protein [Gemmataceae bacterium]